jgi:hypothetical protein
MKREAKEDAGFDVDSFKLYETQEGSALDLKKRPYEFVCHYFEFDSPSDVLQPQDPDRLIYRAEWIALDDFRGLGLYYDFHREIIKKFWTEKGS